MYRVLYFHPQNKHDRPNEKKGDRPFCFLMSDRLTLMQQLAVVGCITIDPSLAFLAQKLLTAHRSGRFRQAGIKCGDRQFQGI